MKKIILAAAAAATACLATVAMAQGYGGGRQPSAILYDGPNFQGRQTTIYGMATNLPSDFNDRAMSGRFQGRWRICEDSDFRGRCQDVNGDVANMNQLGMGERISSLQAYMSGGWGPGPGGGGNSWRPGGSWNGPNNQRPYEGTRNVFFPYPTMQGYDIAAGSNSANAFCRSQGLGSSAYYDSSERSQNAVDGDGRFVGPSSVLRDVLCRRY